MSDETGDALGREIGRAIEKALRRAGKGEAAATAEVQVGPAPEPFRVLVRGIGEADEVGVWFEDVSPRKAFEKALACKDYPAAGVVIRWRCRDRVCALDIDIPPVTAVEVDRVLALALANGHAGFTAEEARRQLEQVRTRGVDAVIAALHPQPTFWWRTHGGGVRLVYLMQEGVTAHDQAVIARHLITENCVFGAVPVERIEIKTDTRHPHYPRGDQRCGPVEHGAVWNGDTHTLKRTVAVALEDVSPDEPDEETTAEWLAECGLVRGKNDHAKCPIDPRAGPQGDPVFVGEAGVYCHVCAANGTTLRGGKPGFASFASLVDGRPARAPGLHRTMVRNKTHWDHAKYQFKDRETYRAYLRLYHVAPLVVAGASAAMVEATTRLVNSVFKRRLVVRANDKWADDRFLVPLCASGMEKIISHLPAVAYLEDTGRKVVRRVDQEKVGMFLNGSIPDLTEFGYPSLSVVKGCQIGRPFTHTEEERRLLGADAPRRRLYATTHVHPPFAYRDAAARALVPYVEILKEKFPGVVLDLIRLLIAAKGIVQTGRFRNVPMVFVTGQSGAGKDGHASLAAELACDTLGLVEIEHTNVERMLEQYGEVSQRCGFALLNESDKGTSKFGDRDILNTVLKFDKNKSFRQVYKGTVTNATPAVGVFTGTSVPDVLLSDDQGRRRFVVYNLGAGLLRGRADEWFKSCGTGNVEGWRENYKCLATGFHGNAVADCLVSEVIDRFFGGRSMTVWGEIVKSLGFTVARDDADEDAELLVRLFAESRKAEPSTYTRRKGEFGWVEFNTQSDCPLAGAYRELMDGATGDVAKVAKSRISSKDWGRLLKVEGVECDLRLHGSKAWIRYRIGEDGKPGTLYTRAIPRVGGDSQAGCSPVTGPFPRPRPSIDVQDCPP